MEQNVERKRLTKNQRAAQFLPFDALKGLQAELRRREENYGKEMKREISEEKEEKISNIMQQLEIGKVDYAYDNYGNVTTKVYKFRDNISVDWSSVPNAINYGYSYSSDSKKRLTSVYAGYINESYGYDALGRLNRVQNSLVDGVYKKRYGYYKNKDHATNLINSIFYYKGDALADKEYYTYDSMGNITSISKNGNKLKEYKYDTIGRIIYEKNIDTNREISYTYDRYGNILTKQENGTTIQYVYFENGIKLKQFGNLAITYDVLGNANRTNSTYTYTWENGSKLKTANGGSHTISYTYDSQGLMRTKVVSGTENVTYTYTWEDGKLIRETDGTNNTDYLYGKDGIIGFKRNDDTYFYEKNLLGDIIKIYDSTGSVVAEYSYTAFGECSIITNINSVATINPFRYRSYFYDSNLQLYYLKSRFYNPVMGRFISQDNHQYLKPDTINGLNLYAYCGNNPVMRRDPNGNSWKGFWNKVGNFFEKVGEVIKDTVGGFIDSAYEVFTYGEDYIWGGWEVGEVIDRVFGDTSKPISFFVKTPSNKLRFWDYGVGFNINFGKISYSMGISLESIDFSIGGKNNSYEISMGIDKTSFSHVYSKDGVVYYEKMFVRNIFVAAIVCAAIWAPQLIPVLAGAAVPV